MKSKYLSLLLFLLTTTVGLAQVKIGVRAGISSYNLSTTTIEEQSLRIAMKEANYGLHFGAFMRAHISERFYVQPELIFNSNNIDYEASDDEIEIVDEILGESYHFLDIPVLVGYKFGPLHIAAGPVGHAYIASNTELDVLGEYEHRLNNFNVGYQAGIGLDILRLSIDIRYEGNFNDFGEHIYLGDTHLKFSENANRWIATLGYAF